MDYLINETKRRRKIQIKFNKKNKITPKTVYKSIEDVLYTTAVADSYQGYDKKMEYSRKGMDFDKMDKQLAIEMMREEMLDAAHKMDYEHAAHLRDEIAQLEKEVGSIFRQLNE